MDAMLAAEPALQLADKTEDSRNFVQLDDTIIKVSLQGPVFMIQHLGKLLRRESHMHSAGLGDCRMSMTCMYCRAGRQMIKSIYAGGPVQQ